MAQTFIDEPDYPRVTPAVRWLIGATLGVYFLQLTVVRPEDMERFLGFTRSDLPYHWWRAFTYMFAHGGLIHVGVNMFMLWQFGPRVEHSWSAGAFLRYYVLCGLGGWLLNVLVVRDGLLIGASAAVLGVMLAYASQWPDEEVLLLGLVPIRVKWYVVLASGLILALGMSTDMGAGTGPMYFAHVGGLAAGWLLLRTPSPRRLEALRQRISPVPDEPDETPRAVPRVPPRTRERPEADEVVSRSKAVATRRPAHPVRRIPIDQFRGEALNLVLDKISAHGLDSLTADERRLLEEMSKRLRDR
jgi:membrane associated rhomboid family serine protease